MKEKERRINITNLVVYILRGWKAILIGAVLGAVLFGTLNVVKIIHSSQNQEPLAQSSEELAARNVQETTISKQQAAVNTYELNMANYTEEIRKKEEYIDNSVLMKIDPYKKNVVRVKYLVTSEDSEEGEIDAVLTAYVLNFASEIDYSTITKKYGIGAEYLQELVTMTNDLHGDILTTICTGIDEEMAINLSLVVEEGLFKKQEALESFYNEHNIQILSNVSSVEIDNDLAKRQSTTNTELINTKNALITNRNNRDEANRKIEEAKATLKELDVTYGRNNETAISDENTGFKSIVRDSKLFIFAGFVLGCIVVSIIKCLEYIFTPKLRVSDDISYYWNIPVIGTFDKSRNKGILSWFDNALTSLEGVNTGISSSAVLETVICIMKNRFTDNMSCAVCGCGETGKINDCVRQLQKRMGEIVITSCANIKNPDSIECINNADIVLLVEQRDFSLLNDIDLEVETIRNLNKQIIGAIIY